MNLIIILLLFLFSAFALSIVAIIIYHIITYAINRFEINVEYLTPKRLKLLLIFMIISISFYQSYTAVYPTDSFYFQEFEYVTLQEVPDSAEIKYKKSSYPDFHGDYSSESMIELSESDYKMLYNSINSEGQLIKLDEHSKMQGITFQRNIPNQEDQLLYIHFLNDGKTIQVNIDYF